MTPYYERDGVVIYHGEALRVLTELGTGTLAGCFTDPPYSSGGQFRSDRSNRTAVDKYSERAQPLPDFSGDNRDQRAFLKWCALWMAEVLRVCEASAPLLTFTDWRQLPSVTDAVQAGGWNWQGLFVWDKVMGRPQKNRPTQSVEYVVYGVSGQVRSARASVVSPGDSWICPPAIIRTTTPAKDDRQHVTEKPVDVLRRLIPLARPGLPILDPFMGSGTTLRAAKDLGRHAVGIEREESYCEIAAKRLDEPAQLRTRAILAIDSAESALEE